MFGSDPSMSRRQLTSADVRQCRSTSEDEHHICLGFRKRAIYRWREICLGYLCRGQFCKDSGGLQIGVMSIDPQKNS